MFPSKLFAVMAVLTVGWLRMPTTDAFGISSFGKANTEPPRPATTTASPGKTTAIDYTAKKTRFVKTLCMLDCCERIPIGGAT